MMKKHVRAMLAPGEGDTMKLRRPPRLLLAGLSAALITFSARAQQEQPRAVVDQLNAVILNVMKESSSLGFEGRYAWLDPVIRDSFNLPFMAETATGIHWSKATDAEKRRFVEAFSEMTTAIYAVRYDSYAGETFQTLGEEMVGQSSVLVRSEIVKADGNRIPVHYLLRNIGGVWRIVDVYAWGKVSELAGRQANYEDLLKMESLGELSDAIEKEIADLRREDALRQAASPPGSQAASPPGSQDPMDGDKGLMDGDQDP
jgi:phospholipid transport system substrate-binding protein